MAHTLSNPSIRAKPVIVDGDATSVDGVIVEGILAALESGATEIPLLFFNPQKGDGPVPELKDTRLERIVKSLSPADVPKLCLGKRRYRVSVETDGRLQTYDGVVVYKLNN